MRPNKKSITKQSIGIGSVVLTAILFSLSIGIGYCNTFVSGYWY